MKPGDWRWLKFSTGRRRYCYLCHCEITYTSSTVDHFRPKAKGGSNNPNNFRLCCLPCNAKKGASMPLDVVAENLRSSA